MVHNVFCFLLEIISYGIKGIEGGPKAEII